MKEAGQRAGARHDRRRREFLRSAVRWPLVAALGLLAGRLVVHRGPLNPDETCTNRGVCRGCSALAKCGLPQATLARKAPY
jgi:hypothetical protein